MRTHCIVLTLLLTGCATTAPTCPDFDVEAALSDYAASTMDWTQARSDAAGREHKVQAERARDGVLAHVACLKGGK